MKKNTVTTVWKKDMVFESDNPNGHKIQIDASEENGGTDNGLSPKALMLSSLAGCSGLDVVSLLKKMRVEIDNFTIEITGELTEEHPKYYHAVKVDYHFYGHELDEKKVEKAVTLSVNKYCGVMEMFRKFATIETNIHYHNV
ncbi:OsmC family protein [Tenacibaculum sp. UWU-22]|uniref:OsmC family protein n=1 Tax=Tenacibaculum sp. UWU-22 TaxID=3234187 RepID=UPI0034DB1208